MDTDGRGRPALAAFLGTWEVRRSIDDRAGACAGRFTGTAVLAASPEGAVYDEAGEMRLGRAAPLRATRRYLWRAAPDGTIAVAFADGRAFHRIGPELICEDLHLCAPDRYAVRYDFTRWPRWSAAWTVSGPRKDYTAHSHYAPRR